MLLFGYWIRTSEAFVFDWEWRGFARTKESLRIHRGILSKIINLFVLGLKPARKYNSYCSGCSEHTIQDSRKNAPFSGSVTALKAILLLLLLSLSSAYTGLIWYIQLILSLKVDEDEMPITIPIHMPIDFIDIDEQQEDPPWEVVENQIDVMDVNRSSACL